MRSRRSGSRRAARPSSSPAASRDGRASGTSPRSSRPSSPGRFHGRVVVHDAADPALVPIDETEEPAIRVAPSLVETDLVVVLSAAETVLHGGPATLLAAANAEAQRRATTDSLLETSGSEALAARDAPRARADRARPRLRRLASPQPPADDRSASRLPVRRRDGEADRLAVVPRRGLGDAGPCASQRPAVAARRADDGGGARRPAVSRARRGAPARDRAEARDTAGAARRARARRPGICAAPSAGAAEPVDRDARRPRALPRVVARLVPGGGRRRRDPRPPLPSRVHPADATPVPRVLRPDPDRANRRGCWRTAEAAVAGDTRALEDYRAGRTVHPLLPFRDWDACHPALERLGAVYVAGARDAAAVRQLGFIPIGSVGAALQMARGQQGPFARVGFLLTPPYFPLKVGLR